MTRKKTMTTISDSALITNVGYNTAGNTSLICKGTSFELWDVAFVVTLVHPNPYAAYSPQYVIDFKGKTMNFTYTGISSTGKPTGVVFIDIV